jgi:transcriptional regulator with XRE-family HTH domain
MATIFEENSVMVTLASNLRTMRTRAKLSQKALADSVGVSYPRISEIENGRGNPTLETLEKIAAVLGVQVAELFKAPKPLQKK